jgi:hypothetical protein
MKIRTLVVAMLVALLTMAASAVNAQDTCFGLAADDCTAIGEASANTAAASSFHQSFTLDFSITGIPGGDVTLNVTGEGPVAGSDSAAFPLNFSTDVTVAATTPDGDQNITLALRAIDGILYIQDPASEQWAGMDIAQAMSNPQVLGLPIDPAQLADPAGAMGLDAEALGASLPSLMALAETPGFLTYTRDGDTYTFTADIGLLLKAPEYSAAATSLGEAFSGNPQTAQFASMLPLLPMVLNEGKIVVTQVVDPELNAVTGLGLDITGVVNSAMAGGDASAAPINLNFSLAIELSQLDGEFTFEVPEGAQMMPMGN